MAIAIAVLAFLALTPPAPAAAEPSGIDTAGDVLTCALGPTAGAVTSLLNSTVGTSLPSCVDGAQQVGSAVVGGIKKVASGAFEAAGLNFGEAGAAMLKFALGWWITIPGQDANSFMATLGQVTQYTYWIQAAFLTVSVMLLGARLAMARSGTIRDTSTEGLQQLARATVLSGSLGFFVVLGTRLSDNISEWFIDGTVGSDPDALVDAMVQIGIYATPGGVALLFVIGILGILGGLMMAALLLLRMGWLVVITAALPIAGAAGGTKIGSRSYEKMIAWTLAALLFKPVGSFVIGVAAMLFMQSAPAREDNGGAMTALIGVLLLCSAALVLPMLMRLIVPDVSAVGGGGSGAAIGAAAVAVGAQVGAAAATGGASAGAGGAAAATTTTSSTGAAATSGAPATAPPSFGTGGGGTSSPKGGDNGTPSSSGTSGTGAGPQGGDNGTPTSSGASSGEAVPPAPASGAPRPSNGGFEG